MSEDKAGSWVYAEESAATDEHIQRAFACGVELGAAPVSAGTGAALRALAGAVGARVVLEIGTGVGASGLYLLEGMAAEGVLTSIDIEAEFHRHARQFFRAAGIPSQRTRLITGRSTEVLPRMAAGAYDMVVIDAGATNVDTHIGFAKKLVRPGGVVALIHALWHDKVPDPARRDPETVAMREALRLLADREQWIRAILPVGDGLAVAISR
ncbi:MAG: class I SAM-dependent methyltransferase [Actinomycetaceae bacterium]|nr:class I SAM-dependent methyltransferase [Actinomycetaceae bacterium]